VTNKKAKYRPPLKFARDYCAQSYEFGISDEMKISIENRPDGAELKVVDQGAVIIVEFMQGVWITTNRPNNIKLPGVPAERETDEG
jgi:hypothetical protein